MSMTNELSALNANKDRRNENFFKRVFKYFLPWKGDGIGEIFRKFVFIGSIVVFCFSVGELMTYINGDKETLKTIKQMQDVKPTVYENNADNATSVEHEDKDNPNYNPPQAQQNQEVKVDESWKELLALNNDIIGWISVDSMKNDAGDLYIDYAVMQGDDNDFYLKHNELKKYSQSGSLFADYRYPVTAMSSPDNVIIYGHNMNLAGTYFSHLAEYQKNVEFLRSNPLITFNTLYSSSKEQWVIISCFVSNAEASQDPESSFNYIMYQNFDETYPFETWKAEILKRSWYSSDIDFNENDKFLTLSTCCNAVNNTRLVIVARKVRVNDDVDALIKTYKERNDADIYFPRCWTKVWGNRKVYKAS